MFVEVGEPLHRPHFHAYYQGRPPSSRAIRLSVSAVACQGLEGALFGPLKQLDLFNTVVLDPEVSALTWPNGADFDPATPHDWHVVRDELVARARRWAEHARSGIHSAG
jgi:hypothetical protein